MWELHYKIEELANGNLNVYDGKGRLCWKDISRQGFKEILCNAVDIKEEE